MSGFLSLTTLMAILIAGASAPDTPADATGAEAVLAGKGLVRAGKCYVLPKVDEAITKLGLENMQLEMSKRRIGMQMHELEDMNRVLEEQRRSGTGGVGGGTSSNPAFPGSGPTMLGMPNRGRSGFAPPTVAAGVAPNGASNAQVPLTNNFDAMSNGEMVNRLLAGKAGMERLNLHERQVVNLYLSRRLLGEYDELAADDDVRAALKVLNRGRPVKLAVGPPSSYDHRLAAMAAETLREKGLKATNKSFTSFSPTSDEDAFRVSTEADKVKSQLLEAEKGRGPRAGAPGPSHEAASALKVKYVGLVRDLRRRVDEDQNRRKGLLVDPEVAEALETLDKLFLKQKHKLIERKNDEPLRRLESLEATVETARVDLEADRDALWVEAVLNDSGPRKLVLDTQVDALRLSARTAAEVGAVPDGPTTVDVKGEDGLIYPARRSTLKSLRVGPFVARDVACVLMPESAGDPSPILGGVFLTRYVAEIDATARRLTLSDVNLQQHAKATPATTAPAPAKR